MKRADQELGDVTRLFPGRPATRFCLCRLCSALPGCIRVAFFMCNEESSKRSKHAGNTLCNIQNGAKQWFEVLTMPQCRSSQAVDHSIVAHISPTASEQVTYTIRMRIAQRSVTGRRTSFFPASRLNRVCRVLAKASVGRRSTRKPGTYRG